jgi:hypothetical protein
MSSKNLVRLIVLFGGGGFLASATGGVCLAQSEPRQVVLPVEVIQIKKVPKREASLGVRYHDVYTQHTEEILGLSAKSFHIKEDGTERQIQHFSAEKYHSWLVQDNVSHHREYSCTPTGIWGGPDKQEISFDDSQFQFHTLLISYVPPQSPRGSCHHVVVKVNQKHAKIFAPNQECNTDDPLSDPLNGTSLGDKVLRFANSSKSSSLPLVVQVVPFLASTNVYRINVSAELPTPRLQRQWNGFNLRTQIAILGLVYDKNNALVSRFSDIACLPSETFEYVGPLPETIFGPPSPMPDSLKDFESSMIPTTYQTQLELGLGEYRLELILTDGAKFGRATTSFKLDDLAKDQLAISGIALCKRYRQASAGPRSPTLAPQYIPLVSSGTELTPVGKTRFHKGEPFISYFEAYGAQPEDPAVTMSMQVKVADAKTGEIKLDSGPEPLKFSSAPKDSPATVVRTVSIETLPPGSYQFEAQVSDSAGHKTAWSLASFTVE